MKNFTAGEYPHEIQGTLIFQGNDLIFLISGGTKPHIGAVSIAYPDDKKSATASTFAFPGHREDLLARSAALKLSKKFKCNVVTVVGIHVDNASNSDIDILQKNFETMLEKTLNEE